MATAIPSTYTVDFALPKHLPDALKDLTREILRSQPSDIHAFAREFFEQRLENDTEEGGVTEALEAEGEEATWDLVALSPDEIEEMIHSLFKEQDVDGNRTLDRHEFKMVFHRLGRKLGLRVNDVRRILAEADCDGNGAISYAEFIPVAVSIIETIVAKEKLKENEQEHSKVMIEAADHVYNGMPESELNEILTTIFKEADKDGSGALDLEEFERCLSDIRIGFTRKEVKLMMFETYSKDGMIDYERFKPLCMKLLVELTAAEWIKPVQEVDDLTEYLLSLFGQAEVGEREDSVSHGLLHIEEIQRILYRADLGMSLVQICSILSEAQEDEKGMVDYTSFAPRASFMIHACNNYRERLAEKKRLMSTDHAEEGWGVVFGKDRDTIELEFLEAFENADTHKAGCLTKEQIKECIVGVIGAGNADRKTLTVAMSLAKRVEAANLYLYRPIVDQIFRTLKSHIELSMLTEDN